MYGLEHSEVEAIKSVLSKYPQINEVLIFGSRAKGNFRPNSDIDLTLVGNNIDLELLFSIDIELDDLLLPYRIDTSIFHDIDNKDLLDHIKRVGKLFYKK